MAADNNDINSGSETESDVDDYNPSPTNAKTFARHAAAADEETRRRMAAVGAAASSAKRQQSLAAAPSSAATASQAGSPRMMYHPYHHHHGQPASIEPGPDAYYHQQQQLMQVQHQQLHPHHLQQQQQQQHYHDSMMMHHHQQQHPQYPQYGHPQYAAHMAAMNNIPPPPGVARAEVHVAAISGAGGASSHIKKQQYPHQHPPPYYAVPMAALNNNIPNLPPPPPAVTPTRAPPGGGGEGKGEGEGVAGQTPPPPPPPVVDVDLKSQSQHDTSTTTTKTHENSNKSTIRLLNHDLSLLKRKKKTQKKRETIATVRVQVPHETLLPGNKMLVELAGTCSEYQYLPPFEVVVPPTVQPGTIITVQIPTTIHEEEDGILMHHPLYQTHSPKTDQQQQQKSEQEQYLKKKRKRGPYKRKRGPYKKKVPPPPSDTPTTTSSIINSNKNGMPHSKPTATTTTVTCCVEKQWMTVFQRLKVYQQDHPQKSTRVPRHYHHDAELGRWVHQQRLDQQQELLTEEQQQLLKSMEFDFAVGPTRASDLVWSDMYPQLVAYHTKHGHTKLTKKLGAETQLITWAARQRTRYHKTPRTLPAEHIRLLHTVDFDFDASLEKNWTDKYQLLMDYKQQHQGNTRAPKSHPTLGIWVKNQRNKEKTMTKERHALLCAIDFDWEKGFTKNTAWLETKIRTEVGGHGRSSAAFLKKEKREKEEQETKQRPEEDESKQHNNNNTAGNIPQFNNTNTNTKPVRNRESQNNTVEEPTLLVSQNYELKYV